MPKTSVQGLGPDGDATAVARALARRSPLRGRCVGAAATSGTAAPQRWQVFESAGRLAPQTRQVLMKLQKSMGCACSGRLEVPEAGRLQPHS